MTEQELKEHIIRLAEPVVTSLGLSIWGVEIAQASRMLVRLYVDMPLHELEARKAAEGQAAHTDQTAPQVNAAQNAPLQATDLAEPVTDAEEDAPLSRLSASLDQCESISRHLGLALEVEDLIPSAYVLEVSTPGLSRPFFSTAQMRPYLGAVVEARLLVPVAAAGDTGGPRRKWCGRLLQVEDDAFVLEPVTVSAEGQVSPDGAPSVRIAWSAVRRASRVYIFSQPVKPGKQARASADKNTKKNAASSKTGASAASKKQRS